MLTWNQKWVLCDIPEWNRGTQEETSTPAKWQFCEVSEAGKTAEGRNGKQRTWLSGLSLLVLFVGLLNSICLEWPFAPGSIGPSCYTHADCRLQRLSVWITDCSVALTWIRGCRVWEPLGGPAAVCELCLFQGLCIVPLHSLLLLCSKMRPHCSVPRTTGNECWLTWLRPHHWPLLCHNSSDYLSNVQEQPSPLLME